MNTNLRSGKARVGLLLLMILIVLLSLLIGAGFAILPHGQTIGRGTFAEGFALGGLTAPDAEERLAAHLSGVTDQRFALLAGDASRTVTLRGIGVRPDVAGVVRDAMAVGREGSLIRRLSSAARARWQGIALPLAYTFDEERIVAELTQLGAVIDHPPTDASARWTGSGVVVTPERVGAKLDVPASTRLITQQVQEALTAHRPVPSPLRLIYREKYPRVTSDALAAVDTVLGEYSTSYATSSRNRASNIETATRAIHRLVLLPGETFSFNGTVGPRTAATGFRVAPVIVNGQMDSGIGGGICQVSTTLYNAVLLANLQIVTRSHHSLPSHYVKPGLDATVSYGALDFRFRNSSDAPIVIEGVSHDRRLVMRILGKGPKPEVQIVRSGVSTLPGRIITKRDPSLPNGARVVEKKGGSGLAVTVTRVVGSGPDAKHEIISKDRYSGEPTIVRVGAGATKAANPTPNATSPAPETPAAPPASSQL